MDAPTRSSSIEDKRFWTDPGVDIRGIARAFLADVTGGSRQGASTIAQQFVKNALSEQNNRTDLREAPRGGARLPPDAQVDQEEDPHRVPELDLLRQRRLRGRVGRARVLRQGPRLRRADGTGATSADTTSTAPARGVRDGTTLPHQRDDETVPRPSAPRCSRRGRRRCWPAWSPRRARSTRSPTRRPPGRAATSCSRTCSQQHYITRAAVRAGRSTRRCRPAADIQQPEEPTAAPYFTSWLRPQILAAMGLGHGVPPERGRVPGLLRRPEDPHHARPGDAAGRRAGRSARSSRTGSGLPSASLVAIDNKTGEVRAMVGGPIDRRRGGLRPLPVQPGHRGSPPARLGVQAVHAGRWRSMSGIRAGLGDRPPRPRTSSSPTAAARSTSSSTTSATRTRGRSRWPTRPTISDNTVYAQVGIAHRHEEDRAAGQADGNPLAGLEQLRDDPRRAQGRRHAARHGARLRDASPPAATASSTRDLARPTRGRPGSPRSSARLTSVAAPAST